MVVSPPASTLRCPQCGGELHLDEGQIFLICPFCGSTVHADKSRLVFHWSIAKTLDPAAAQAALARWMAGNQTVKDLDRKSRLTASSFEYFPVWYLREKGAGAEQAWLEPAAATSVTELKHLRIPAGDLRKYDPSLDPEAATPTVPLDTVLGWLESRGHPRQQFAEIALIHIPVYTFKYGFQGKGYTAVVEAVTGRVFANLFPAKAEAPYQIAAAAAAGVFLCLSAAPLAGYLAAGPEGMASGLLACLGLGALAAPALFALAVWVAAKV